MIPARSKGYALGGLGVAASGRDAPAPIRYGAETLTPRTQDSHLGMSSGVHPAVGWAYDHPGVRFADRSRGRERPLSAEGTQTFHFRHGYYSKTSPIAEMIKAARSGRKYTASKATDHLLYIERDGAAENVAKEKEYPGYDPDVAEDGFTALEREVAGRSAEEQQDFLERIPLKNLTDDEIDDLEIASFGTIGDTLEERRHFWKAVERIEADPRGDTVTIRFSADPKGWDLAIKNLDSAPSRLRDNLRREQGTEPKDVELRLIRTDEAFAIHQWVIGLHPEVLIEIERGRGGRVQNRIIAELPFELDGRERVEIVRNFTNKLTEKGLPFWAVVHAPDQNNDKRNFHAHIVYYDRPSSRMKDPRNPDGRDVWDFEIEEEKVFPNRHRRTVCPFLQEKLREANRRTWIPMLRKRWATASNEVMEKVGVIKRYDARSYEAMGIQLDPLEHIPPKTFNRERKGELTEEGVGLACRQWHVMQDRLVADHAKRAKYRQHILKRKTDKARQILGSQNPYRDLALKEVDRLTKLIGRAGTRLSSNELSQDLTRIVINRVASRPKLIIEADRKKNEKGPGRTRSKAGQGQGQTTQLPRDEVGAAQPVGQAAKEAMAFLLEFYRQGVHIDQRNEAEIRRIRSHLNVLLKRLDNMMADPKRHPLDRRSPGFIDLNIIDPGPEVVAARKKERMDQIVSRLDDYVLPKLPQILANATGASPSKPEPSGETNLSKSEASQPSVSKLKPVAPEPKPVAPSVSRDASSWATDRVSQAVPADMKPSTTTAAKTEVVQEPVPPRQEKPAALPPRTRSRPEPFYKPKETTTTPAAAQMKNAAAAPTKSPAQTPINSAAQAPVPNNPKSEAATKPVVTGNSQQPAKPSVNNVPKPGNTVAGTKPIRDNAGSAVSKPATAASAPAAPVGAQRPVAAPTNTNPAPTQAPPRPAQAPAAPSVRPTAPQAGSTKETIAAKVTSAPAPAKALSQAPAQVPFSRPEPPRAAPGPATGTGKSNGAKAASEAKAPARPDRTSVAPKPSTAPSGPARTPGERSSDNPAVKPTKEEAKIRVGNPISPVASKPIEPIRVEEKKPPKKPKRRGKGRDEGPSM
jgi:hypothetical protein